MAKRNLRSDLWNSSVVETIAYGGATTRADDSDSVPVVGAQTLSGMVMVSTRTHSQQTRLVFLSTRRANIHAG